MRKKIKGRVALALRVLVLSALSQSSLRYLDRTESLTGRMNLKRPAQIKQLYCSSFSKIFGIWVQVVFVAQSLAKEVSDAWKEIPPRSMIYDSKWNDGSPTKQRFLRWMRRAEDNILWRWLGELVSIWRTFKLQDGIIWWWCYRYASDCSQKLESCWRLHWLIWLTTDLNNLS